MKTDWLPLIIVAALSLLVVPPAVADELSADEVKQLRELLQKQASSDVTFTIGAHVNRAVNVVDDGVRTTTYFVDSSNYPTLLYVKGTKQYNDDLSVTGHIEYALQQNAATSVSQDNQETGLETSSRFFELIADSKSFGTFWVGRGFMSSFMATEIDKSETWRYNLLSPGNSFGGVKFTNKSDGSLTDIPVLSMFLDVEAFSFRDRVRYDSPAWHGLQVSGSAGSGDSGDVTLRWIQQLGGFSLFAGASYQNNPLVGRIDERSDGGIGVFHEPTGLNLSVGAVRQKFSPDFYQQFSRTEGDNDGWIARVGIRKNWFGPGETRFAVDFSRSRDALYKADEADSVGVFTGQMIDKLNLELYAGYRGYKYDAGPNSGGLDLNDIHAFVVGTRIGFDVNLMK